MRRSSAVALAAACVAAPLLWVSPASAEGNYPPTGPTGGGGTVSSTEGSVNTSLPRTGTDLRTPAIVGGGSVLTGTVLLVAYGRRRRSASS
jgi:LPXTG-motif cell wall-anchored protein